MATEAALAGADSAAVSAARDLVIAFLADRYPTRAVRGGPISDLFVLPAADALAAVDVRGTALADSADPELALSTGVYDPDILAAVLAGRGVVRHPAAASTGSFAVHLSNYQNVVVPSGYQAHTADGVNFVTIAAVRVVAPGATPGSGEAAALTVPGGGYAVVVGAKAAATGVTGNVPAGTALTADSPLAAQTALYAATDFLGGADAETDAALLARLPAATAARTVGSTDGLDAVVTDAYPYAALATIGFGHDGMRRGRTGLTGQSPGRVDLRVRTADSPSRVRVPVTATLIATVPFGRWRFSLDTSEADAPGRFSVEKILQRNAALSVTGYPPALGTAGFDISGAAVPIDIRISQDAALSAYATAVVEFIDPDTSTSGMIVNVTTRAYDAVVRTIPGLTVAQAAVEEPGVRATAGDCLVRGACPVMVSLTVVATVAAGVSLTSDQVAAAVARAINGNGISQILAAGPVAARAAAYLPQGTSLTLSGWSGAIYGTDGTIGSVTGTTGLSVATNWAAGLGPDAVAYYADPTSIASSVAVLS